MEKTEGELRTKCTELFDCTGLVCDSASFASVDKKFQDDCKGHSKQIKALQKDFKAFFERIERCTSPASFADEKDRVSQLKVVSEHLDSLLKAASDQPTDIDAFEKAMEDLGQNAVEDIPVTLSSVLTLIPCVGNFKGHVAHGKYEDAFNTLQSSNSEVPSVC